MRECLPLVLVLRNRLKYAINMQEVQSICMDRLVKVDGKVRTDVSYPAGFMDTISIEKTNEFFKHDTDGDNAISFAEFQKQMHSIRPKRCGCKSSLSGYRWRARAWIVSALPARSCATAQRCSSCCCKHRSPLRTR